MEVIAICHVYYEDIVLDLDCRISRSIVFFDVYKLEARWEFMGHDFIREANRVRRSSNKSGVDGMTHIITAYVPILGVVTLVSVLGHLG